MISYRGYTNDELRNALLKLKEAPRAVDFPVIEQIEHELRRRGKKPEASHWGKDVVGLMIKEMQVQNDKRIKALSKKVPK